MKFVYEFEPELEYHFDVDESAVKEALTNIIIDRFVTAEISEEAEKQVREMVSELIDSKEKELAKWYYDELKEVFYNEARERCYCD